MSHGSALEQIKYTREELAEVFRDPETGAAFLERTLSLLNENVTETRSAIGLAEKSNFVAALPTAAAEFLGRWYHVRKAPAADDEVWTCIALLTTGYAWRQVV